VTKLVKHTIIRIMTEMLEHTEDIDWIREEICEMFNVEISDDLWALLHLQAAVRTHATPQLTS